ncbi:hypothetical protein LIER_28676 [Lithospermum erythrorhizon]|uniref:Uncharacterized protein n=1 Tax=Lithospermum erythrorhizon TaxID=34254 RepID=A0AAV3RKR5_LITER
MEMKTEDDQVMYVKQEPEVFLDKEDGETSIGSGGYNDGGGGVVAVKAIEGLHEEEACEVGYSGGFDGYGY